MNIEYRALLLAAGLGTRLKPFTDSKPKCLIDIGGKPLLEYWLESLENSNCKEVLINTHYLSEQVFDFVQKRPQTKMKIKTTYEKDLLGTAGTLMKNITFFKKDLGLLIHADNFTKLDLNKFIRAHLKRTKNTIISMVTFLSDNPSSCGIVDIDQNQVLLDFNEKPANPKSSLANAAIYAFEDEFLQEFIKLDHPYDFSKDVIDKFIGKIQTWKTNEILIDIGTPKSLAKSQTYGFLKKKKY